ncbi:MAG: DNA-binding response regulator [Gammaproteobacteria bacterium]|nr:MAG: DNA-binding response regulator [Gammaproteobacteria bacterium]RLA46053.1 MAG: DNA-binding response regulator [Gammaproteobacteria bacterium]
MTYTIAIVEDDPDQRHNYCAAMEKKGFTVNAYADRLSAQQGMADQTPDLVILDIMLGHEVDAGFQLCRDLLASNPTLPVLFLTERIDEIDQISGLRLGAWDYQPKPISLAFLAERVASLLRLKEIRLNPEGSRLQKSKQIGQLNIQEDAMVISWRGKVLDLTLTEFRLLARLVRSPGHATAYETMMKATIQQYVTNNTINTHMRNIRRKFTTIDPTFDCIHNEYGFGYRWVNG